MNCDERHLQLSSMMDAEPGATEHARLFAHLDECPECRRFLDSLIRVRDVAKRDRAQLLREADELLAARAPMPVAPEGHGALRDRRGASAGARPRPFLTAPAAVTFAALLLVVGIAIGAGLALQVGRKPAHEVTPEVAKGAPNPPTYVYVCSMQEYEVTGRRARTAPNESNEPKPN